MIIINGNTDCLCLEENIDRFFNILEWSQNHLCMPHNERRVTLEISKSGLIIHKDEVYGMDLELCDVNEFYAVCKTCSKRARSSFDFEDESSED
jgi:hypothetical protein